MMKDEVKGI